MTTGQRAVAAIRAHLAATGTSWAKLTGDVVAGIIDAAEAAEKPKRPPRMADGPWLESLKADPANAGIDIDNELVKMKRWCVQHNKQPTRHRFTNWLNNADRVLGSGQTAVNTLPEITGWKFFLELRTAEGIYHGEIPSAWEELPRDTRQMIHGCKYQVKTAYEFARNEPESWKRHLEETRRQPV